MAVAGNVKSWFDISNYELIDSTTLFFVFVLLCFCFMCFCRASMLYKVSRGLAHTSGARLIVGQALRHLRGVDLYRPGDIHTNTNLSFLFYIFSKQRDTFRSLCWSNTCVLYISYHLFLFFVGLFTSCISSDYGNFRQLNAVFFFGFFFFYCPLP
jgi:hypothetical protein